MNEHTLGDAPIQEQYRLQMKAIAKTIDEFLNGPPRPDRLKKHGFILMVFPFDEVGPEGQGRANYMSNADRRDVIIMLREQLARFEGFAETVGKNQ